jgi:hypothetical protein
MIHELTTVAGRQIAAIELSMLLVGACGGENGIPTVTAKPKNSDDCPTHR